jgi:membrane protein required for colicin V production
VTFFDWIIIAIVCFFAVKSLLRGAVREICSLLALMLAGTAALRYYPVLLPFLRPWLTAAWAQTAAAGTILFLGVYICVSLAGWLVALLLQKLRLGFLDRTAGIVVGAAKAYVLVSCILILLLLVPRGTEIIRQSTLSGYGIPVILRLAPHFPEPLRGLIKEKTAVLTARPPAAPDGTAGKQPGPARP